MLSLTCATHYGPAPLHLRMQRGCKTQRKILPSVGKHYASVVYSLHTCFIRSIHRASVRCDFVRANSFELHKTFRTDELSTVHDVIRDIYEQQTFYVRFHPLNVRCILSVSSGHSRNSHPLQLKTEKGRKNKLHGKSIHG